MQTMIRKILSYNLIFLLCLAFPGCSRSYEVNKAWIETEKHLSLVQKFLHERNRPTNGYYVNSSNFLSDLTGIARENWCEGAGPIGILSAPTELDLYNWSVWYEKHKDCLSWIEEQNQVLVCCIKSKGDTLATRVYPQEFVSSVQHCK